MAVTGYSYCMIMILDLIILHNVGIMNIGVSRSLISQEQGISGPGNAQPTVLERSGTRKQGILLPNKEAKPKIRIQAVWSSYI
jgi:hypothetical protein